MFITNNTTNHQNISLYSGEPLPKSNFDDNEIVLFIIWSFVGVVLGIQIVAVTSVLIWAILDCCKVTSRSFNKLKMKYFQKRENKVHIKPVIYEPILTSIVPQEPESIGKLELDQNEPDIS